MLTPKLSIVLIDDHLLLLESLTCILKKFDFIKDVKSFNSAKQYLSRESEIKADIIITDIIMPELSGIELLTKLENKNNKTKLVVLSCISEIQTVRQAIRNGASAYLTKNISVAELEEALFAVYNGKQYVSESLRNNLVQHTLIEDRFFYTLSPRQKEVLHYVCMGKTIKETASAMQLSANTVQTYYKSILKKINLNRTADLIVFAIHNGLYNPKSDGGV